MRGIDMTSPSIQEQAGKVLGLAAGYVGARTVSIGLDHGMFAALADAGTLSPQALADGTGRDPFYVEVWCRAALASELLERDDASYRLAPHVATLLLDETSPAFAGAMFTVLQLPEVFDLFSENLATGQRTWWDEVSPKFIETVGKTGTPFNVRLIPGGLDQVPGLTIGEGTEVCELACGLGVGLQRMAEHYPGARFVGVDGDAYSIDEAWQRLEDAGVADRVETVVSTLERIDFDDRFDLVTINISMHEARDLERVTRNVHRALRDGGHFVISDLPFPDTDEGLRTVPGRLMSGIQYFEALIGDQLLPTSRYVELLEDAGFEQVDSFQLTPVHVVVHGVK
jgi:ubiquinone/menaquinone biosynthesis C-methylase UbiE